MVAAFRSRKERVVRLNNPTIVDRVRTNEVLCDLPVFNDDVGCILAMGVRNAPVVKNICMKMA